MTLFEPIKQAMAAADRPIMLESADQVTRAAKAWRRSKVLAVDTEFVRERTFYAKLGLVQISDAQSVWLLDPLQPGTLAPLKDMLEDNAITKLLHSPSEDLEVLLNTVDALPRPLVDTQMACALLGQPLQLGYHGAAHWLMGVDVDKDQTRSNWCARPLSDKQVRYAALDVNILPLMWQHLQRQLDELGRSEWLAEDCARMLEDAASTLAPEDAWCKVRGHARLDGTALAVLAKLAAWREVQARERDLPRGFVVPDAALMQIAGGGLRTDEALATVEGLHPRTRQRHGATLLALVNDALNDGERLPTTPRATPDQRKTLNTLRDITAAQAASLNIEPALLASRKELEQLVFSPPADTLPGRLGGWRAQFLAEPFLRELVN
jgi:ribonuclease D